LRKQGGDRLGVLAADRIGGVGRCDARSADDAVARAERHVPGVEPRPAAGAGAEHRGLADAAAQAPCDVVGNRGAIVDLAVACADEKDRSGEPPCQRFATDSKHVALALGSEQRGGELAQLARTRLARVCRRGLALQRRRERADEQGDGEHRDERDQVLAVLDRERVARRHEEEVECGDGAHGRRDRTDAVERVRRGDDGEEVHHRLAGQRDDAVERGADRGRCSDRDDDPDQVAPRARSLCRGERVGHATSVAAPTSGTHQRRRAPAPTGFAYPCSAADRAPRRVDGRAQARCRDARAPPFAGIEAGEIVDLPRSGDARPREGRRDAASPSASRCPRQRRPSSRSAIARSASPTSTSPSGPRSASPSATCCSTTPTSPTRCCRTSPTARW
jgi:hypothetical protein